MTDDGCAVLPSLVSRYLVPRSNPSALGRLLLPRLWRQIDLSADYSPVSEQGPAGEQLEAIFPRMREDDALEVHRQSNDSFDVLELDSPLSLENDFLLFLGVDEPHFGFRRAVPVRKLAEEEYLSMPRRIFLGIYGLNNVNNAWHPGDFVEDDPAARNR